MSKLSRCTNCCGKVFVVQFSVRAMAYALVNSSRIAASTALTNSSSGIAVTKFEIRSVTSASRNAGPSSIWATATKAVKNCSSLIAAGRRRAENLSANTAFDSCGCISLRAFNAEAARDLVWGSSAGSVAIFSRTIVKLRTRAARGLRKGPASNCVRAFILSNGK
jgi:hypothetical protein